MDNKNELSLPTLVRPDSTLGKLYARFEGDWGAVRLAVSLANSIYHSKVNRFPIDSHSAIRMAYGDVNWKTPFRLNRTHYDTVIKKFIDCGILTLLVGETQTSPAVYEARLEIIDEF